MIRNRGLETGFLRRNPVSIGFTARTAALKNAEF
jgi:hypothetical protein